jgi:heme b synthase
MQSKPATPKAPPRMIAWEITRQCNLNCAHCRASAEDGLYEGELSTEECHRLIDDIATTGKPILILTGGEPLMRDDIFDLARYATTKGLTPCIGTNGTLITEEITAKMKRVPISRVSVSIDFPDPEAQDWFRGVEGAFDAAVRGIQNAQRAGVEVQINCTITKMNLPHLESLLSLALDLGVASFHPFIIVPTGRGKGLKEAELTPAECERALRWIAQRDREIGNKISFRPTCAPFYFRITEQQEESLGRESHAGIVSAVRRGCLAGIAFCFISHVGRVQGCGYLDIEAGNIKERSFADIWRNSPPFNDIRDPDRLKGKCGDCDYRVVCGGCRARAYEVTGDYMESEPYCAYQPTPTLSKQGVSHV